MCGGGHISVLPSVCTDVNTLARVCRRILRVSGNCSRARALFTPLKMQMLVINPAFAHLFVGTAPCFIKPIYHSELLNQWDAEESRVSTEARRENTGSLYKSGERGALRQE